MYGDDRVKAGLGIFADTHVFEAFDDVSDLRGVRCGHQRLLFIVVMVGC